MQTLKDKKLNPEQEIVYNHILDGILDSRFPVGERIPTEMELSCQLGASRMNVHRALIRLEERRLLFRNKRGGTRVAARPNTFATSELKREISRHITVLNPLSPQTAHIHWGPEITGVLAEGLRKHGLDLRVENIHGLLTPEALSPKLEELSCNGTAGLLVISFQELNGLLMKNPELFFRHHRNIFIYSRDLVQWSNYPYNIVSVDLFNEGIMAAEYAVSRNYNRFFFAYPRHEADRNWLGARLEGVQCALKRLTGKTAAEVVFDENREEVLLALHGGDRVAIIASCDQDAVLFQEQIRIGAGKTAGRDYGLVSFNNDVLLRKYRLTTIAPPLHEIGEALAEMIAGVTCRQSNRTSIVKIQSQLIPGESC